jgi:hypothetical protein
MKNIFSLFIIGFMATSLPVLGQDEMMDLLEAESNDVPQFVASTFKGTRLINGHNVETRKKGIMDFIISHRFGKLNSGAYELFGLDQSNVRIGFDFGITDAFNIGVGRNSFEKTFDGYLKYRLVRQKTTGVPLSITAFSSMSIKTLKDPTYQDQINFSDKLAYTYQILMARKFSQALSLQLMPTLVHFNTLIEEQGQINNDIYALGVGGRVKITKRISINAEYYYRFDELSADTFDAIAIGLDIETGGHVFQLQFTNSRSMIEKGFISEIKNDFFKGDIHFGFNISRTFQLIKSK